MLPASNIVGALYHKLSRAPEDGHNHHPKHVGVERCSTKVLATVLINFREILKLMC
jgi:hypothetical protein